MPAVPGFHSQQLTDTRASCTNNATGLTLTIHLMSSYENLESIVSICENQYRHAVTWIVYQSQRIEMDVSASS